MPEIPATEIATPSPWVARFAELIPPGGRVLDVACGRGRHARHLAARGFLVEAVDRDADALATLAGIEGIDTRCADLENGPWPYHGQPFAAVVVTRYLWRPLLPHLLSAVEPGGVLIYETFMNGNERFGSPANPAFLLRHGELLDLLRPRFHVVAFEQGEVATPAPAVIQRICATRNQYSALPT